MAGRPANTLNWGVLGRFDAWRKANHLSERRAALILGVHPATLGRMNKTGAVSHEVVARIEAILTNTAQAQSASRDQRQRDEALQILQELAILLPKIDSALNIVLNRTEPAVTQDGGGHDKR